jgi:hypothetical protein
MKPLRKPGGKENMFPDPTHKAVTDDCMYFRKNVKHPFHVCRIVTAMLVGPISVEWQCQDTGQCPDFYGI